MHSDHGFFHVPMCAALSIKPELCRALLGRLCLMGPDEKRLSIIELIKRRTRGKSFVIILISFAATYDFLLEIKHSKRKLDQKSSPAVKRTSRCIKFQRLAVHPVCVWLKLLRSVPAVKGKWACAELQFRSISSERKAADGEQRALFLLAATEIEQREEEQ